MTTHLTPSYLATLLVLCAEENEGPWARIAIPQLVARIEYLDDKCSRLQSVIDAEAPPR